MITELLKPAHGFAPGTPVKFRDWVGEEQVEVEFPSGETRIVSAGSVESGLKDPEEIISVVAQRTGVNPVTLRRACDEGRVLARKSGSQWVTTENAVRWAIETEQLRPSKIERIRAAIRGNRVGVSPERDVYYTPGVDQGNGETPKYIDVEVFGSGIGMTEDEYNKGIERRSRIVEMLNDAGIGGFVAENGKVHFLND